MGWDLRFRAPHAYYVIFFLIIKYLLYSSFLLSTLLTTLQGIFFFSFIKLNRFCVFVAFLLYTIWFLSKSFIDMLKFYVWSHLLLFFFRSQYSKQYICIFLISYYMIICCWYQYFIMDLICYGFCLVLCSM